MSGDAFYFTRRAQEERSAALTATSEDARRVHSELADRYEQLSRHPMGQTAAEAQVI